MSSTTTAPASPTAPAQVAINDIGTAEDFLAAIEGTIKEFNDGDIVEGVIVRVDRDEVLLDIGYKTEGVIPSRELSIKHDVDPNDVVKVGDEVEALVLQKEDKEGRLILSKKRAQYERAWGTIEKIKDEDGIVTGTVIEVVKGGLILDIGLRGFLPASLVEMRRVRDLQPFVGKELEAKIIELDKNRNNVVLSRRAWLEQTQSEVRQNFLTQLQKGQVRKGVVSSIVNFGAFVDLGGVDGLVHVSELSWKHIDHPSEVVEVGQEVTVEVLDVDMDRERVSLSLKATQEDPWQAFARTHAIGQVVPGRVTKLVPFGAFVRVAEGIEGLVHISELAERHVEIPEQVVNVGDEIYVKVIDIDLERRRISLSLKQANEGTIGEAVADHFDPAQYGMPAQYDDAGNYIYPEGFDADTGEWKPGFEAQQAEWEAQYAAAQARWEAHQKQIAEAQAAEAAAAADETTSYTSEPAPSGEAPEAAGTLASDEALAELRRKLTGGEDEPAAAEPAGAESGDAAGSGAGGSGAAGSGESAGSGDAAGSGAAGSGESAPSESAAGEDLAEAAGEALATETAAYKQPAAGDASEPSEAAGEDA
jgi:small subunit ribosomal protein S1